MGSVNFIARDKSMGAKVRVKFFIQQTCYPKAINSVALKQKYKLFHFNTRAKIIVVAIKNPNYRRQKTK